MKQLRAAKILEDLAKPSGIGPTPSFNIFHILKALELINKKGYLGRTNLSNELKIGEGATRTIIEHLKNAGIIRIEKLGAILTKKGQNIINELNTKLGKQTKIDDAQYSLGTYNYGILIKKAANKVKVGIEQRDSAVKAGAAGTVTMIFSSGRLYIPPTNGKTQKERIIDHEKILETFNPSENDVIIICGAGNEDSAENGARAAAWTLFD